MATAQLYETLEYIRQHPEQHDQEIWLDRDDCGTTACLAGWGVALFRPELADAYAAGRANDSTLIAAAVEIFGVTRSQGDVLFNHSNTLEELMLLGEVLAEDPEATIKELIAALNARYDGNWD